MKSDNELEIKINALAQNCRENRENSELRTELWALLYENRDLAYSSKRLSRLRTISNADYEYDRDHKSYEFLDEVFVDYFGKILDDFIKSEKNGLFLPYFIKALGRKANESYTDYRREAPFYGLIVPKKTFIPVYSEADEGKQLSGHLQRTCRILSVQEQWLKVENGSHGKRVFVRRKDVTAYIVDRRTLSLSPHTDQELTQVENNVRDTGAPMEEVVSENENLIIIFDKLIAEILLLIDGRKDRQELLRTFYSGTLVNLLKNEDIEFRSRTMELKKKSDSFLSFVLTPEQNEWSMALILSADLKRNRDVGLAYPEEEIELPLNVKIYVNFSASQGLDIHDNTVKYEFDKYSKILRETILGS